MIKHTPGPWYAVQYANEVNIQTQEWYSTDDNLLDIETCLHALENGKLAAAAPDLLQVCRTVNELFKSM